MNILQEKKMLPRDQSKVIEQTKFTYFPLGKVKAEKENR